jgi:hypothetical protein
VPAPTPAPEPLAYPGGTPAAAPAPAPRLPGPLANLSGTTLLWVQVVGGVLAALATFFPWYSVSSSGFEGIGALDETFNGYNKSGGMATLILLLGLAVAALAFVTVRNISLGTVKLPWFVAPALAVVLFLFSLIEWISTLGDVSDARRASSILGNLGNLGISVDANSGFGIWLLIIVSVVTAAAAVLPALPQITALVSPKKSA